MHIQRGNRPPTPGNSQMRQINRPPPPTRLQMLGDDTVLNPERLIRQSRGISDPLEISGPHGFSNSGRFDPAAAAFEPQYLQELHLERDRSQAFYNSMNDQVGFFLKLSEELEYGIQDLDHLSKGVRDVVQAMQNRPVDLQLQVSKLEHQLSEIEAITATHRRWNGHVGLQITAANNCWVKWERPAGRRPWL